MMENKDHAQFLGLSPSCGHWHEVVVEAASKIVIRPSYRYLDQSGEDVIELVFGGILGGRRPK